MIHSTFQWLINGCLNFGIKIAIEIKQNFDLEFQWDKKKMGNPFGKKLNTLAY